MSSLSTDKRPLVDYGVQIRFIKDLHDTGGGYAEKTRGGNNATPPSNKYGVAVRVQGISGQPYVVLKDGEKGDSYGVQLKSQPRPPTPNSGPSSPYNSLSKSREATELPSPYAPVGNAANSPISPPEDEGGEAFGSPFKRPPGDGQAGSQGEREGRTGREGQVERLKAEPPPKMAAANGLEKKERGWANGEEFNEAGLKPVNLNGVGSRVGRPNGASFSASLGKYTGKKLNLDSFPEPPPPVSIEEEPVPAIDTNSLAPINKLINRFNSSTPGSAPQTRGRSGARQRLRFDERRRSRSLDARKDVQPEVSPPSPTSPILNPYATTLSPFSTSSTSSRSSAPSSSILGRSTASVTKVTALSAPKPSFKSPGKFVAKDTHPAIPKKPVGIITVAGRNLVCCHLLVLICPYVYFYLMCSFSLKDIPAPLRNQGHSAEVINGEEAQAKQAIYNILKEG